MPILARSGRVHLCFAHVRQEVGIDRDAAEQDHVPPVARDYSRRNLTLERPGERAQSGRPGPGDGRQGVADEAKMTQDAPGAGGPLFAFQRRPEGMPLAAQPASTLRSATRAYPASIARARARRSAIGSAAQRAAWPRSVRRRRRGRPGHLGPAWLCGRCRVRGGMAPGCVRTSMSSLGECRRSLGRSDGADGAFQVQFDLGAGYQAARSRRSGGRPCAANQRPQRNRPVPPVNSRAPSTAKMPTGAGVWST